MFVFVLKCLVFCFVYVLIMSVIRFSLEGRKSKLSVQHSKLFRTTTCNLILLYFIYMAKVAKVSSSHFTVSYNYPLLFYLIY